jgi:hypothetical protein
MRKKTIYVHIGTPKTGTTSIQAYLTNNDEKLANDGYLVPKSSRLQKKNHILLPNYCLKGKRISDLNIRNGIQSEKQLKQFRDNFYHDFREEISQFEGHGVILSSEQLYGKLQSEKDIQELKNIFEDLYDEIKIIVYIREQAEMLCSLYSTRIKGGNTYTMPGQDRFSRTQIFDFNQRLKLWERVFGIENIVLRIFEKDKLHEKDVVSDFCKAINIPKYEFEPIRLNQSLNAKQCEFLRLINEYIPSQLGRKVNPVRGNLRKMVAATKIESPPVSALINKDYQGVYDERNRELQKRYFGIGTELFRKKPLNEEALDQTLLLNESDKKSIANQIIQNNMGARGVELCKCIAAICGVEYEHENIPMAYVHSLKMNKHGSRFRGNLLQIYHRIYGD